MERLKAVNQWLTLVANVSVVAGIIFLGFELQQNTQAIQGQTRDAITGKQMEFSGWVASSLETSDVYRRGIAGIENLEPAEGPMFTFLVHGIMREWENSLYQYEQGLFSPEEFEARLVRWRNNMGFPGYRQVWGTEMRETFAPSFRDQIDRLVAEVEQGQ